MTSPRPIRRDTSPEELAQKFPNGPMVPQPGYRFKKVEEAGWFIAVAIITVLAQELLTFDGTAITNWQTWAVALASALVRGAAGAMIAWFGKQAVGSR